MSTFHVKRSSGFTARESVNRKFISRGIGRLTAVSCLALAALLAACSSVRMPGVHRIDIQQGNVVTQEMLDKLEPGMEKRKVRFVLGTPLLVDVFNPDRWDYVYSLQQGGGERKQRRISLFFENERLVHVQGNVKPSSGVRRTSRRSEKVVTVPEKEEHGFFGRLTKRFSGDEPETPGEKHAAEPVPQEAKGTAKPPEEEIGREDMAGQDDNSGFNDRLAKRTPWEEENETESQSGNNDAPAAVEEPTDTASP